MALTLGVGGCYFLVHLGQDISSNRQDFGSTGVDMLFGSLLFWLSTRAATVRVKGTTEGIALYGMVRNRFVPWSDISMICERQLLGRPINALELSHERVVRFPLMTFAVDPGRRIEERQRLIRMQPP